MYKLYTDKSEIFEAKIEMYGTSHEKSTCRLMLETDKHDIAFKGTIKPGGKIEIPVQKLKSILPESTKGTIKLEVIVDESYFCPWEEEFEVLTQNKITLESVNQKETKKEIKQAPKPAILVGEALHKSLLKEYIQFLNKEKVGNRPILDDTEQLSALNEEFIKKHSPSDESIKYIAKYSALLFNKL